MLDPVIITAIHPYHTKGCEQNKDQLVLTRACSGDYSKFCLLLMKNLMAMMNLKTHSDSDVIRAFLLRRTPQKKGKSEHDIASVRIKYKMLQKLMNQARTTMKTSNTTIL